MLETFCYGVVCPSLHLILVNAACLRVPKGNLSKCGYFKPSTLFQVLTNWILLVKGHGHCDHMSIHPILVSKISQEHFEGMSSHKCPLELIRGWSEVKGQGDCELTKHFLLFIG